MYTKYYYVLSSLNGLLLWVIASIAFIVFIAFIAFIAFVAFIAFIEFIAFVAFVALFKRMLLGDKINLFAILFYS